MLLLLLSPRQGPPRALHQVVPVLAADGSWRMHAAPTGLCSPLGMCPVETLEKSELTEIADILFNKENKTAYTRASNSNEVNFGKQEGANS